MIPAHYLRTLVLGAGLLVWLLMALCMVGMSGCGTSTDRQTQTVEREKLIAGPLVVDTPIGQFVMQPATVERQRTQDEVERTERRIVAPEVGQVIQAAAGATPWGGILTGLVGVATAAFAGKKALDAGRQRNELIAGVERAKSDLGDKWDVLTGHLEAEQNADTKAVVRARTASA